MTTTVPDWVREEAARGNGKPYTICSLGLDPADPHHWTIAISNTRRTKRGVLRTEGRRRYRRRADGYANAAGVNRSTARPIEA